MPAKMGEQIGFCPKCDGPLLQPPSFASSMDQAFRSFGQPGPNFGSLDDLMRGMSTNDRESVASQQQHSSGASPRAPLWRHGLPGTEPRTTSSSSSSSSSVRYDGRGGGGAGLPRSSLGGGVEVRASDVSTPGLFAISLDVADYRPEEIKVKTVDQSVVIEGRHEERRPDGSRYVSRNFSRSWTIPNDVEPTAITSRLSSAGTLTVEAPRKAPAIQAPRDHVIPVNHGAPTRRYF